MTANISHPTSVRLERRGFAARWLASRATPGVGLAALTVAVLAWPMLFTNSGLEGDWEHHLWFIWHQGLAIRADGTPSMFINTNFSVFYPQYAFYGGTIYVLAGALAVGFGNSPLTAYILTYLLGFCAAYGGWYWIGRTVGLGRHLAHVPALLFVTSACYLTLLYGRGDWPEFLAVSMLPLMIAAGLSVLRSERLRLLPAVALVASTVIYLGSHILTVLWASTILGLTCAALVAFVPEVRRQIPARRWLRLGALMTPALLANAWFLLPMVAYSSHTLIGSHYHVAQGDLRLAVSLVTFRDLFALSLGRSTNYLLTLPTLTIVWILVSIVMLLVGGSRGTAMRIIAILATVTAGIVVVMTHVGLILDLPKQYTLLQFSYRLEDEVLIGVTATLTAVLALAGSAPGRLKRWHWTILPILALSIFGAVGQVGAYTRTPLSRSTTFTASSEVFSQQYVDYSYVPLPLVSQRLPTLDIRPSSIHDDRVSFTVRARPGQLFDTNIGGGPNLLHIGGARVVGSDEFLHLVLAVGSGASASASPRKPIATERVSIAPAQSTPVVLGRLLTIAGVAILLVELVGLTASRCLQARRPRARPASSLQGRSSGAGAPRA
jgi:hypothetical protein